MPPGQHFPDCIPSDTSPKDGKRCYAPKRVPNNESRRSTPSNGFLTVNQQHQYTKGSENPCSQETGLNLPEKCPPDYVRDPLSQGKFQDQLLESSLCKDFLQKTREALSSPQV